MWLSEFNGLNLGVCLYKGVSCTFVNYSRESNNIDYSLFFLSCCLIYFFHFILLLFCNSSEISSKKKQLIYLLNNIIHIEIYKQIIKHKFNNY